MTAYRQQALAVANALATTPSRPRDLRILAPDAAKIHSAGLNKPPSGVRDIGAWKE
jgi:hypothetical protein